MGGRLQRHGANPFVHQLSQPPGELDRARGGEAFGARSDPSIRVHQPQGADGRGGLAPPQEVSRQHGGCGLSVRSRDSGGEEGLPGGSVEGVGHDRRRPTTVFDLQLRNRGIRHEALDHSGQCAFVGRLCQEVVGVVVGPTPGQEEVSHGEIPRVLAHSIHHSRHRTVQLGEKILLPQEIQDGGEGEAGASHPLPSGFPA